MTIYGSEGWINTLDWVEVVLADFDFASDVLFCLEVYWRYSACTPHLQSGSSSSTSRYLSKACPTVLANVSNSTMPNSSFICAVSYNDCCMCGSTCDGAPCAGSWSTEDQQTLEIIWILSVVFIVAPVVLNLYVIYYALSKHSDSGIAENIAALHAIIKTPLLNPFFILFYLLLHIINILLIATSAERLAKILVKDRNPGKVARFNTVGFVSETVPQLVLQGLFLSIVGANITTVVSVSISSYRTVSSYLFKVFRAFFPRAAEPEPPNRAPRAVAAATLANI